MKQDEPKHHKNKNQTILKLLLFRGMRKTLREVSLFVFLLQGEMFFHLTAPRICHFLSLTVAREQCHWQIQYDQQAKQKYYYWKNWHFFQQDSFPITAFSFLLSSDTPLCLLLIFLNKLCSRALCVPVLQCSSSTGLLLSKGSTDLVLFLLIFALLLKSFTLSCQSFF